MSWYVGQDGQQVWVQRDEVVFTVVLGPGKLPVENLTYLATHTKKAVYQEHIISQDLYPDGKSRVPRRQREKQSGQQRGFIVRADIEESPLQRVLPSFKAVAQRLIDSQVVSRVDTEEAVTTKKKKGEEKAVPKLGANECRVETTARISHFAHGPGFKVEVTEGSSVQKIHLFTGRREQTHEVWHASLTGAMEAAGSHVMLARKEAVQGQGDATPAPTTSEDVPAPRVLLKKDKAQQDDDLWFESVMNVRVANTGAGDAQREDDSDGREGQGLGSAAAGVQVVPPAAVGSAAPAPRAGPPRAAAATSRSEQLKAELQAPDWRRAGGQRAAAQPGAARRPLAVQGPGRHLPQATGYTPPPRPPAAPPAPPPAAVRAQAPVQQEQWEQWEQHDQPLQQPPQQRWQRQQRQAQQRQEQQPQQPQQQEGREQREEPPAQEWEEPPRQQEQPREAQRQSHRRRQQQSEDAQQGEQWAQERQQQGWEQQPLWQRPSQQRWRQQGWQEPWHEAWREAPQEREPWREVPPEQGQQWPPEAPQAPPAQPWAAESGEAPGLCGECKRGRPLKLFQDEEDGQWYCRRCWLRFYGVDPPAKG